MARFTGSAFRRPSVLADGVRAALPTAFEAVAEALAADSDVTAACAVVGRDVARDGAALGEALSGLRSTFQLVAGAAPTFAAAEALSVAWSEATLEYLHDLSCEDPLTGLASLAHLRTRLAEIYRDAELSDVSVVGSHALVVVELQGTAPHRFARALRLVRVTEALRSVWSGGQTLGRLGPDRAAALVPRTRDLGMSTALLREVLADLDLDDPGEPHGGTRVWVEGLPASPDAARQLLDELAR